MKNGILIAILLYGNQIGLYAQEKCEEFIASKSITNTAQISLKLIKDKEPVDQTTWQHSCDLFNELATTIKDHSTGYLIKANALCDTLFTTNPENTHGAMTIGLFDQVRSIESEPNAVVLTYTLNKSGLSSQAWEHVANIVKTLAEKGDKTTYLEAKNAFLTIVQFGQGDEQAVPIATKKIHVESAPAVNAVANETETPK